MSLVGDAWESVSNALGDSVSSGLEAILNATIYRLLYYIEYGLCWMLGMLDQMFQVFAGINKVTYAGERDYLISVFFRNHAVSNIYWGMALIGIALCFGFAIAAVVRKMFDSSGKVQQSLGQTITTLVKSIFLILGMSAIMVIVLNSTNILMQQINYLFSDSQNADIPKTIVYTDEEYAAMGRALNTIGNYSLNPSYNSRFNINTCFNEIRKDLYYLQQQGVFRYYYAKRDQYGKDVHTWQSVLQDIANSADLRYDLLLDKSYDSVSRSITGAMDVIRNDASFKPLESYTRVTPSETVVPLDRMMFLMGAMHAAKNDEYNKNPGLDDPLRGPYYTGEKSIYDLDQVTDDFEIGFAAMDYLVVFTACIALIFDHVVIMLNCIARIFNMLFLYLIAPPIFAAQPLDNGGKTRQWMTAFIVQAFSVFGTVIAMRLLIVYLPIIAAPELVLFPDSVMLNLMAKLVLIYGGFEAAKKSTALLTGILADSAGWQSIQAGDMTASAARAIGSVTSTVTGAAKGVAGVGLGVAGFAAKPLTNLAKRPFKYVAEKWSGLGSGKGGPDNEKQIKNEIALNKAKQEYANTHPEDAQYLSGVKPPPAKTPAQPMKDLKAPDIAPPEARFNPPPPPPPVPQMNAQPRNNNQQNNQQNNNRQQPAQGMGEQIAEAHRRMQQNRAHRVDANGMYIPPAPPAPAAPPGAGAPIPPPPPPPVPQPQAPQGQRQPDAPNNQNNQNNQNPQNG